MQKFSPTQYLKIDIANNFGLDKKTWSERLAWFDQNENNLTNLVVKAENPALFYAGIKALHAVQQGEAIGYPVSLDATSSGLQILAVLVGDTNAAALCNVVNTGKREDAYTGVYQRMLDQIGETSKIDREDVKRSVMTALYGSKAVPKEVFGEGMLLRVFEHTMVQVAPAAWELNQLMLEIWNPEALSNDWVLPDNFHVHVKVMAQRKEVIHWLNEPVDTFYNVNAPIEEGRSLGANMVHSIDGMMVREIVRRCDYQPKKIEKLQRIIFKSWGKYEEYEDNKDNRMVLKLWEHFQTTGFLSARILDHLKAENIDLVDRNEILKLIDSLPAKPFKVIAVHDCFRCLPNYMNDLREQYTRQLMLIAKSNLLTSILSQIIGKPVSIGKMNPDLWKQIMDSDYALS
jgi:hypothetical protein